MPLSAERDNADIEQLFNERRKDHISHFVCRLAFCRTDDQRRWLLTQEQELFRCEKPHLCVFHLHNILRFFCFLFFPDIQVVG